MIHSFSLIGPCSNPRAYSLLLYEMSLCLLMNYCCWYDMNIFCYNSLLNVRTIPLDFVAHLYRLCFRFQSFYLNFLSVFNKFRRTKKVVPRQAEMAQGVSGRLRPRIFLTFGTTRVVGRQPYALAAVTPGEIPGPHFSEAESTPGHMVPSGATEKIPTDTTGNRSRDLPTSSAVP